MIDAFPLYAGLMVLAAAVLTVWLPRLWRRAADGESNLDWLAIRREELAREGLDADALNADANLRVLEELKGSEGPAVDVDGDARPASRSGAVFALVLLTLLLLPFVLYQSLGAIEDVHIAQRLSALEQAEPEEIAAVLAAIEQRSQQRPENADYLSLLGQYYTASEQHASALTVYEQLLTLFPESPEVLARVAQAEFMASDRTLSDRARRRAEAALATDPNQRTALGTLGMGAFEAGDYAQAVSYWQRLLAFETPGTPGFQMLSSVIERAQAEAGLPANAIPDSPDASSGPRVAVAVLAPADAAILPSATVFVFARPAGQVAGMPTAVVRRSASELPLQVELSDATSMAGQKLSALSAVDIEVQISPQGMPGRANATWLAQAANVVPSADAAVELILQPVAPTD